MEMEEFDDMDMDGFDLPCPKIKEKSHDCTSEITLNRHISFGPISQHSNNSNKQLEARLTHSHQEEEKVTTRPIKKITNKQKPYSIADHLKDSLKSGNAKNLLAFDVRKASLFASKSNDVKPHKPKQEKFNKAVFEEEKEMSELNMEDFDEDEMDLDAIEQPTLK